MELMKTFQKVGEPSCFYCTVIFIFFCTSPVTFILQDGNVRLYSIQGTSLKSDDKTLEAKGPVTDLAYSHDGAFLAVCDANKVVTVFSVPDGYAVRNAASGFYLFIKINWHLMSKSVVAEYVAEGL